MDKAKWRTKSGKKSSVTGERYLPSAAIRSLSAVSMRQRQEQKEEIRKKENNSLNSQSE